MDINYLPDTKKIIEMYTENKRNLQADYHYTDIPVTNFPVDNIRMLYFMVGLRPDAMSYGRGIGAFVYKDGRVFQFHYNIHTPHSKGPHLSNTMSSIEEVKLQVKYDIVLTQCVGTNFGNQAFWAYTPMSCLDEESKTLRILMKSLQTYCRKKDYCKKLRKLDKVHEKWMAERHLQVTTVYNTGKGKVDVITKQNPKLWCNNQIVDSENRVTCIAYLSEGRSFTCPYVNNEERLKAKYPCQDYEEREV